MFRDYIQPILYEIERADYGDDIGEYYEENGLDEYKWQSAGSGFPVRYKENIYIITAKHCIEFRTTLKKDLTKFAYYLPGGGNNTAATTLCPIGVEEKYNDIFAFMLEKNDSTDSIVAFDLTAPPAITLDHFIREYRDSDDKLNEWLKDIYIFSRPSSDYCYETDLVTTHPLNIKGCSKVLRNEETESYSLIFDDMKIEDEEEREKCEKYSGISGAPIYYFDENKGVFFLLGIVIEYQYLRSQTTETDNTIVAIGVGAIHKLLVAGE